MKIESYPLALLLIAAVAGCASLDTPSPTATALRPADSRAIATATDIQAMMQPMSLAQAQAQYGDVAQVGFRSHGNAHSGCGCAGCASHGYQPQGNWACPPGANTSCAPCAAVPAPYGFDPQEFLCDGGDQPPKVTVRRDDLVNGLAQEDTIVHYTTEAGDIEVQPSNRVCLYAPRFASVRKVTGAVAGEKAIGAVGINKPVATGGIELNQPGLMLADSKPLGHADVTRRIDAMRERNRGVPVENIQQINQMSDVLALVAAIKLIELNTLEDEQLALVRRTALAAVPWSTVESIEVEIADIKTPTLSRDQSVEEFTVYDFPDAGRLRICKFADRNHALPGEVVSFLLRVDNVGDSAVTDILVTDNLTTRLEYIEASQTASGGAVFESVDNENGSAILRWKLTDKLRVGESVMLRFRCRVR